MNATPYEGKLSVYLFGFLAATLGILSAGGCSGGGGGNGSSFAFIDAVVEELGELPLENVFLNSSITVEFSSPVDPASVSTQTFRVLEGPDFVNLAPGELAVDGRFVRFFPQLPQQEDLADSGFQPNTSYHVLLRGRPDLNTIRSTGGKPLALTRTIEFSTRAGSPLYLDPIPGSPRVIGILLDTDGNGILDADGDPATPEAEEFFEGDVFFDESIPFISGLHTGSANLPAPNAPLRIGFLFDEPLHPATVYRDSDDDGLPDFFELVDTSNPYPCDEPDPGDLCDRPLTYDFTFEQFERETSGSYFVLATMRVSYGLAEFARHRIGARLGIADLNENRMARSFVASIETGGGRPQDDFFIEDFSRKDQRDSATTALWNPDLQPYLRAGVGFGGDGSDGDFIGSVIDTRRNDGIFNFRTVQTTFDVTIIGDKPAQIRVYDNLELFPSAVWEGDGRDGAQGFGDSADPVPGGRGGPGGHNGGTASPNGPASERGGNGGAPESSLGGGEGGLSGNGPGGGGGAAHRSDGSRGTPGTEGEGGAGGDRYGDPDYVVITGGAGGGAGGNNPGNPDVTPGTSGGSGGGGGGVLMFEAFGRIKVPNAFPAGRLSVNGGRGGASGRAKSGDHSGGGGGGAGGAIWLRCRELVAGANIEANGGTGGPAILPGGRGGSGSPGYIRIETVATNTRCGSCEPLPSIVTISEDILGRSIGRSRFFSTHTDATQVVEWSFDGNVPRGPLGGTVVPEGDDIVVLDENGDPALSIDDLPPNADVLVFFRGAREDPKRPNHPDPDSISPWYSDISQLDGMPMIQWEVRFDIGGAASITIDPANDPPAPGVDDIRVRFRIR